MAEQYLHLGYFSDIVVEAKKQCTLWNFAKPGEETQARVREVLGFNQLPEFPNDIRLETCWEKDGISGEAVSWSVGYGPRTQAWVLRPTGVKEKLPGILALHDHGGYKYYGKEKIADGPQGQAPGLTDFRLQYYGNRAFANELAREGFTVLVHDTFLWGSRRFELEAMPDRILQMLDQLQSEWMPKDERMPIDIARYNYATMLHEHTVEKYCTLLGTTLAGVVSHEDRIAFNYLQSRPDVDVDRCGCIGLSGGGNRSALLRASHPFVRAAVIVGLMSTYPGLLDHNVASHTWMFYPSGWSRYGDWPDLAGCRAPQSLLVQYDIHDGLFTEEGMRAADVKLRELYSLAGAPDAYLGQFYPGPHKFDVEMQEAAFHWLTERLGG